MLTASTLVRLALISGLDHLHGLGLIRGGFDIRSQYVDITPNALALNLYVRCQGFTGSAVGVL